MDQKKSNGPTLGHRPGGGSDRFVPGAKPSNGKKTMGRIMKLYLRFGKALFLAVVLTGIAALISVAIPFFTGQAFNAFHIGSRTVDQAALLHTLFILVLLYITNWIISFLNGYIMLRVSQKLVSVLRKDLFHKLQKLPLEFFDTRSHGDTMSRMTNDVDNISSTIAQTTTQLIASILTLTGSLIVMLSLNLVLTAVVIMAIPLVTILTRLITGKSRGHFRKQQKSLGEMGSLVEESILGLKMVKAFGRQEQILEEFDEINEALFVSGNKSQVWSGLMMPFMNVINNLVFAAVSITGGILSVGYGVRIGTVISFLSYSKQFGQPLNAIAGMFNTIQSALAGAERVFEILDYKEEVADREDAVDLPDPKGEVEFRNVSFSYNKERQILEDVNFLVRPGEVVALVGETGAGKTTIVNLLARFYDTDSGEVLIDGIPVTGIRRGSLHTCFSVVLQDTSLFHGSIMDNIRYSSLEATDEEVIAAAKIARAHDFIRRLPKGYETMVGASSDNLSQGQKQLLAIARAVLCDSPILILDEATSSVDTRTEKEIQRALVSLMKSRTSFLVAHRLSTIRDADHIMVVGEGRILEYGDHNSLMEEKGRYYHMVQAQMGKE